MANVYFDAGATTTAVPKAVENRIILGFNSGNSSALNCDHASATNCKISEADPDLILGSFYQSNGTDLTGSTTWCSGVWYNKLNATSSASNKWEGQKGFGPKGKCTW